MSDTTEMVRLIRHAANRLADADIDVGVRNAFADSRALILADVYKTPEASIKDRLRNSAHALAAYIAVKTLAESVLCWVAACMEPESEPTAKAVARVRALIGDGPYVRTDELLEALGED
jgi:hypothetical protein